MRNWLDYDETSSLSSAELVLSLSLRYGLLRLHPELHPELVEGPVEGMLATELRIIG